MSHGSLQATFARGGSSTGLVVLRSQLPEDVKAWQPILAGAMGSPDPNWRQLNGMGGGISSTSKVCVIEASDRSDVDINYTFVQVGVDDGELGLVGNCGNMSSAVGPVALNEGLVDESQLFDDDDDDDDDDGGKMAMVRILNTNTNKIIHSTFKVQKTGETFKFNPDGDYAIDGVGGTASRITLRFIDPAGAKTGKALPSGSASDKLELPESDGGPIEASLVDVANPAVYVRASDLGVDGAIKPDALQAQPNLMSRLENIRQAGARRMGMDPTVKGVPLMVMVAPPSEAAATEGVHIQVRAISMQQAHKALPVTLALNVGSACGIAGTLPAQMVPTSASKDSITISHPGGLIEVGCNVQDGKIESAMLHRTAKILMKGEVYY
ncbi:Hypothetical predicted protein [Lecanosticta acicola]|uniref:PrpF protein n=1 Tax=Lecanosticta acicola TaxID=111012 RepID=A0AAI8W272_9PEZI|nr:Hypothetical predicted protein [Lecanosticta acicola]